jgi:hypothetical protein
MEELTLTERLIACVKDSCQKYNIKKHDYTDKFWSINPEEIKEIRKNYKIIDVDWLSSDKVNYQMFGDDYFNSNSEKKQVVTDMLDYYLSHPDKPIYKKTDYLCNEKEKICICNTHAHDFRKIYDGINYKPENNYISWIRKSKEPF